jgi:hypothetical protein
MGITIAHSKTSVLARHVREHCRPIWGTACQVSGQFNSAANLLSSPATLGFCRSHKDCERQSSCLSQPQEYKGWLRKVMICARRISLADKWRTGVPKGNGRRKFWRQSCRPQAWTLPVSQWRVLSMGSSRSTTPSWADFSGSFVFPSSSFSRRKLRFLTRSLPGAVPPHCSILTP